MLPEAGGGMQEPCNEREGKGASPALDIIKTEPPSWTPEDFLQSTLHEGKGIVCPGGGTAPSKATRGRRKQQWKLKFHHQALPPVYLNHYEASLNKKNSPMANFSPQTTQSPNSRTTTTSSSVQTDIKTPPVYDFNNLPNESIHNWLQRITAIQNEIQKTNGMVAPSAPVALSSSTTRRKRAAPSTTPSSTNSPAKVLNYRDLPYMGEMTLNNSKPRRGRKPKKADICHLIYKNYGTIFPGTPSHMVEERLNPAAVDKNFSVKQEKVDKCDVLSAPNKQRTDLQNKISSLLEKRLSQENKKSNRDTKARKNKFVEDDEQHIPIESLVAMPSPSADVEPLNLCVRDLNNLKIRLLRKHGNVYAKANVVPKVEPPDEAEAETEVDCDSPTAIDTLPVVSVPESSSPTLKIDEPDFRKALQESTSSSEASNCEKPEVDNESSLPGGYVYWPNAGVFVHPLALQSQILYYQGLSGGNSYTLPPDQSPVPTLSGPPTPAPEITDPQPSPTASSDSSTPSVVQNKSKRSTNNNNNNNTSQAPPKRKRSAIFIPPVTNDTNSSPATEVSICKFKFTGGARPSLQEKKMLSVDSGGNFRYYSGTGDKASRGYEFFPRESLQQAGCGGPLTATPAPAPTNSATDVARRKRKSRKSLQREKLEQTFKEKGFLIQTQQLESAEGATYCKFRQLRKFTRYLFRSWKDYLPGAINNENNDGTPLALPPP